MLEIKVTLHADATLLEMAKLLAMSSQPGSLPASPDQPEVVLLKSPTAVEPVKEENKTVVPTTERRYTRDEVGRAAVALLDQGKGAALTNLVQTFGVQAITQLPDDKLGEFATALRSIGGAI